MDAFSEFLKKEAERLQTCWAAFLSPFKELKLPRPSIYAEEFSRVEKLSPKEKKHVLASLLEETREILSWLLTQKEIREAVAVKGRLTDLEEILTHIKELEEQVYYLREELLRDELTKLWNRRALNIFFPEILDKIAHGKKLYIMVFLDLCDLKKINDYYGHNIGDRIIIQAAKRLRVFTKRVDVPVRIGGDEFILLLAAHSLERAEPFLKELVSEPIRLPYKETVIEAFLACGATDILGEDTLESCLHRADLAMYRHKIQLKDWLKKGKKGAFPSPILLRALCKNL